MKTMFLAMISMIAVFAVGCGQIEQRKQDQAMLDELEHKVAKLEPAAAVAEKARHEYKQALLNEKTLLISLKQKIEEKKYDEHQIAVQDAIRRLDSKLAELK